jgi:hypothetical protein
MANNFFVVKNGIQIGPLQINASTGAISSTSGNLTLSGNVAVSSINKNDTSIAINDTGTGSNVDIKIDGNTAVIFTANAMLPVTDITYDLGSASKQWRDVYVGPGSLYVNGQKVLQEDSGNIVVSADANQNLVFQTSGSGDIELDPVGTGVVQIKGTLQIEEGTNVTTSSGNAVPFSSGIKSDTMTSKTTNTDLTLTGNGTGVVRVDDDMTVTGNLTISGTTTTVNTTTLSVADNIIDLNSDVTTGPPSQNAGLRVMRGDDPAVQIRWNETSDKWEFTTDGTNYSVLGDASALPGNTTIAGNLTPTVNEAYDLGSSSLRFRDLYLSGSTIDLGGSKLSKDASGDLEIKDSSGNLKKVRGSSYEVGTGSGSSRVKQTNSSGRMKFTDGDDNDTGIEVKEIAKSGVDGTGNIGQSNNKFNTIHSTTFSGQATTAQYADLAENYQADKAYEPGTVVEFSGAEEVTIAAPGSARIAGVVSSAPGFLMNSGLKGANVVAVAFTGRVPCKVTGAVRKGDMLVASGNGHATVTRTPQIGQVIGKALANFDGQSGVIEVAVGRY